VIGEPYAARSVDLCWDFYEIGYSCFRDLVYGFLTCISAPCIAAIWGCEFGIFAFHHVWFITPLYRFLKLLIFDTIGKCCKIVSWSCIRPCFRGCAPLFFYFRTEGVDYDALDNLPISHPVRKIKIIQTTSQLVEQNVYLGDREKMNKSISRQMKLY